MGLLEKCVVNPKKKEKKNYLPTRVNSSITRLFSTLPFPVIASPVNFRERLWLRVETEGSARGTLEKHKVSKTTLTFTSPVLFRYRTK